MTDWDREQLVRMQRMLFPASVGVQYSQLFQDPLARALSLQQQQVAGLARQTPDSLIAALSRGTARTEPLAAPLDIIRVFGGGGVL